MAPDALQVWEEQAERRLGILEKKMDEILSPKAGGIYPAIAQMEAKLMRGIIALLVTALGSILTQVALRVWG